MIPAEEMEVVAVAPNDAPFAESVPVKKLVEVALVKRASGKVLVAVVEVAVKYSDTV